jgi:hypothetical protein
MKREFGKKLIEEFFPKIDLTHIVDTSRMGHTLVGHGTPTVILFGRNRKPFSNTIRAVLGIKGEPSTTEDPTKGLVWQSIVRLTDSPNAQDDYISTSDVPRTTFATHPWSIGGGGIAELKEQIEESGSSHLDEWLETVGFGAILGEDDAFGFSVESKSPNKLPNRYVRPLIEGDQVRDWNSSYSTLVLFPYTESIELLKDPPILDYLWPYRTILKNRPDFSKRTYEQVGRPYWEYHQIPSDRYRTPLTIVFAFVATHNHFVLDRGGKVFNRTAPIIKLSPRATLDDHLALLGLLNSSVGCFWLKQTLFDRGGGGIGGGLATENWERFYEHDGGKLRSFPVTETRPLEFSQQLDKLGQQYARLLPGAMVKANTPSAKRLSDARTEAETVRGRMIALQEELDWQCYHLYGVLHDDLRYAGDNLPELSLGERAFEIVLARQMSTGELETTWFERHGSTPITRIPTQWPVSYRKLVERRIEIIETNKEIGLIERPEYKRRWNDEPWQDQQQRALRNWLLDRLGGSHYWPDAVRHEPNLQSTAQLADKASGDHDLLQVAALYRRRPDFDVAALVNELIESESVPFLPVLRYKPSGLRKRAVWERTWDLQRKQDAGQDVGDIPVPPKYTSADFLKQDYWRLRGKLDVPKERWISYPYVQTESDPSLVVGWAGWDHLQQAAALVAYYEARKREGWDGKRLSPILAGLDQLLPWIHQWHPEIDPEFGDTAGQSYQAMLEHDAHELGLTLDDIRNWHPPQTTTRRRART